MSETNTPDNQNRPEKTRRLVIILVVWAVAMFGFGFALVPLYDVMCNKLGFNGKTGGKENLAALNTVDVNRTITVQFVATNNANLPWKFHPVQTTIEVHPGENTRTAFFAENDSDKDMTIQAVPSVTPGLAAKYLKKTECFCFTQQTLKSHESMNMPLLFHIDRDLPAHVNTVTLSYTLFDVTGMKAKVAEEKVGKIR
jgi:cytochrome c oxidase assembly protein subunit 11